MQTDTSLLPSDITTDASAPPTHLPTKQCSTAGECLHVQGLTERRLHQSSGHVIRNVQTVSPVDVLLRCTPHNAACLAAHPCHCYLHHVAPSCATALPNATASPAFAACVKALCDASARQHRQRRLQLRACSGRLPHRLAPLEVGRTVQAVAHDAARASHRRPPPAAPAVPTNLRRQTCM